MSVGKSQIIGDLRALTQCELKLQSTDDFFSSADSTRSKSINGRYCLRGVTLKKWTWYKNMQI